MIAGTLEIQLLANLARLAENMKQAERTVSTSMSTIEGFANKAKMALGAIGVTLSISYFAGLIKGSIDAAERLNDLSKTTRLSVETLSGLKLAAKQSGGDLESLAMSMLKLSQNIGKDPEKYRALGITAKDMWGQFKQLADITNLLGDENQRTGVLSTALGKSWQGAAPFLAEGSEQMQKMLDKGKQLSGMTSQLAKEADEFGDRMAELNATTDGLRMKAIGPLIPQLRDIAGAMAEAAKEGGMLLAVWVGMGGAMTLLAGEVRKLLGLPMTEIAALGKDLIEVQKLLDHFEKNPGLGLLGQRQKAEQKKGEIMARLELLRHEAKLAEEQKKKDDTKKQVDAKDAAEAAARAAAFLQVSKQREEAYQSLMKSINEFSAAQQMELSGQEKLTSGQKLALKIMVDLRDGKVQYTDAEKRAIAANVEAMLAIDAEVEKKKYLIEINKILLDGLKEKIEREERLDEIVAESVTRNAQQLRDLEFETELLKMEQEIAGRMFATREEEIRATSELARLRDIAIAQRQIDLQLQRDLIALGPEITEETEKRRIELEKLAAAQKMAVADKITSRESQQVMNELARNSVSVFKDMWSKVEDTGRQAFVHLMGEGKTSFKAIGQALKTSVIDLLYQMTIRPWIVSIGASMMNSGAGAAMASGVGGLGSLVSGGASSLGGFGNLLSTGNTLGQTFTGNNWIGSALGFGGAGALASSGFGLSLAGGAALPTFGAGSALAGAGGFGLSAAGGSGFGLTAGAMTGAELGIGAASASAAGMTAAMAIPYIGLAIAAFMILSSGSDALPEIELGLRHPGVDQGRMQSDALYAQAVQQAAANHQATFGIGWTQHNANGDGSPLGAVQNAIEIEYQSALVRQAEQFAKVIEALRVSMEQAQALADDPVDYWDKEVTRLRDGLGVMVGTVEDWQAAFLTALDTIKTPEELAEWQQLGAAIQSRNELVDGFAAMLAAAGKQLSLAADPIGFWDRIVIELRDGLGVMVGSVVDWQTAFAAAIDAGEIVTQQQFDQWQQLGVAIQNRNQLVDEANRVFDQLSDQAAQGVIDAVEALRSVYETEAEAFRQTANDWSEISTSLNEYSRSLLGVTGNRAGSIAAAAREFNLISSAAQTGDLDAIGRLQEVSEAYRLAALAGSGSALDYARVVAQIQNALGDTISFADQQESVALQQLDVLTQQVDALIDIDGSVITVADAIDTLNVAVLDLATQTADGMKISTKVLQILQAVSRGELQLSTLTELDGPIRLQ